MLGPVVVREHLLGAIAAIALIGLIVLVDSRLGEHAQIVGLLAVPAFLAAMFVGPRKTFVVAALAVAAAAAWGLHDDVWTTMAQLTRLGGIVLAGAGAVAVSSIRVQRESQLLQMSRIAELAQLAVLRTVPERVGGVDLGIRYISATADARVGGDFYEVLAYDGGVRIVLGDVRGKGVGSVRLASVLVGAFRAADHDLWDLDQVVASMDKAFVRAGPADEDFATAIVLDVVENGDLWSLNCGHPAPLLLTEDSVEMVPPARPSPPLGLGPNPLPVYRRLAPGDRVLAYTDGLIEARAHGRSFDLAATAALMRGGDLQHAVDRLRVDLVRFLDAKLDDDTTLVLLQRRTSDRPADPAP